MKDLRFWSVVLAGAWFLVGLGAGVALSQRDANTSPLAPYADEFSDQFELSKRRRRVLLQLLDSYQTEREAIEREQLAATRDAMEPKFRALDEEYERNIRRAILTPEQRERYDALGRPALHVLVPRDGDR